MEPPDVSFWSVARAGAPALLREGFLPLIAFYVGNRAGGLTAGVGAAAAVLVIYVLERARAATACSSGSPWCSSRYGRSRRCRRTARRSTLPGRSSPMRSGRSRCSARSSSAAR